tara:strand:+ start:1354 stop:2139 length:786 start_codon:yes stop_codon:yes gene_type:complete
MEQLRLNPGSVIFSEGDASAEAYRIVSGKVQITIATKSGPRILSQLSNGEFFGELGMVDALPRSASATALNETVLEVITLENFFDYIASDKAIFSGYLRGVFERLRVSRLKLRMALGKDASTEYIGKDDRTLEEVFFGTSLHGKEANQQERTIQLTFTPRKGETTEKIIERFPFRIGRSYGYNDLSIPDEEPYQVSRNHCCIEEHSGHFFVKDFGSKLGTVVNGKRITKDPAGSMEELIIGENVIILGRDESPHKLRVIVS